MEPVPSVETYAGGTKWRIGNHRMPLFNTAILMEIQKTKELVEVVVPLMTTNSGGHGGSGYCYY